MSVQVVAGVGELRKDGRSIPRRPDHDRGTTIASRSPAKSSDSRKPRLVVEVLSPSTEKEDRTDKLDLYRSLPSVEAVLLVWQDARRVQLVARDAERWSMQDMVGGGEVSVAALDVRPHARRDLQTASSSPRRRAEPPTPAAAAHRGCGSP